MIREVDSELLDGGGVSVIGDEQHPRSIKIDEQGDVIVAPPRCGLIESDPGDARMVGTGAGFIPDNLHLKNDSGEKQILECVKVSNDDSFAMARRLAAEEGILGGISTGANVVAAIRVAKRPENKGKTIVTIGCSTGERYLSTPLADEARAAVGG